MTNEETFSHESLLIFGKNNESFSVLNRDPLLSSPSPTHWPESSTPDWCKQHRVWALSLLPLLWWAIFPEGAGDSISYRALSCLLTATSLMSAAHRWELPSAHPYLRWRLYTGGHATKNIGASVQPKKIWGYCSLLSLPKTEYPASKPRNTQKRGITITILNFRALDQRLCLEEKPSHKIPPNLFSKEGTSLKVLSKTMKVVMKGSWELTGAP